MTARRPNLMGFATQGAGGNEEARLQGLLSDFPVSWFPFDRKVKLRMWWRLMRTLAMRKHDLVVMEGTGIAGGAALIMGRLLFGTRYVVSSGDAVGPFVAAHAPFFGPLFGLYERLLCRASVGFIGWTPYLAGRALTFGAPRAMTAPGWAPFPRNEDELEKGRSRIRARCGIPADALVIGIAGSLVWNVRKGYCYGLEIVRAMRGLSRNDLYALLVGDGTGRSHLEAEARDCPGGKVIFTGRVGQQEVPDYLAAMDVGSLPQTVDGVGSFRYTTKISEYLACSLPVVTGQIPMAYDLDEGWLWRLPGQKPWEETYVNALRALLAKLSTAEVAEKRRRTPTGLALFEREAQVRRVTSFINDLLSG